MIRCQLFTERFLYVFSDDPRKAKRILSNDVITHQHIKIELQILLKLDSYF